MLTCHMSQTSTPELLKENKTQLHVTQLIFVRLSKIVNQLQFHCQLSSLQPVNFRPQSGTPQRGPSRPVAVPSLLNNKANYPIPNRRGSNNT